MSELTRERLALAIVRVRDAHAVPLAKYAVTADDLARDLLAELAETRATDDRKKRKDHTACNTAGNAAAAEKLIEDGLDEDIDKPEEAHRALLAGIGYALLAINGQLAVIAERVVMAVDD